MILYSSTNIKIILSNHSIQQGYKRLGINSDVLSEIAHNSIIDGMSKENVRPLLRNKIKRVVKNTISNGCENPYIRIYDKKIFIFNCINSDRKYKEYTLITFYEIKISDSLYFSMIK